MTGGLLDTDLDEEDREQQEAALEACAMSAGLVTSPSELECNLQAVKFILGGQTDVLQPDIIAEYYVLHHLMVESNSIRSRKTILEQAWRLNANGAIAFVGRCATDFSADPASQQWMRWLHEFFRALRTR